MVKRPKIAKKPSAPPLAADAWVSSGGLDPEVQQPIEATAPESPSAKVKPYPHRISFDTTKEQYKRLKRAAFEEERSLNDVIREAVEDWLKTHNY